MAQLSVIVPVYNSSSTLERCVKSIIAQSVDDMEIILVDDGSTDGSSAMCDELASAHSGIRVIHRENGGLSAARNTGIEVSDGKWIAFVDSDDQLSPDTLDSNLDYALSRKDIDLVEFPVTVHYGTPGAYDIDFQPQAITGKQVFKHWIQTEGYMHCYAWNKIYRSSLFKTIRFPENENFEDAAVCPSIIRECRGIIYSDQGRYLYYSSRGSITLQYRFCNQEPLFRHNLELLQFITDQAFDIKSRAKLWNVCLNLLIDLSRCKDADKAYIKSHAAVLSSLKPDQTLKYADSFKQKLKALMGAKAACTLLSIKKYA